MATSSIPAAIDWLIANLATAVAVVNADAKVFDGFPTFRADDVVMVAVHDEDNENEGSQIWAGLGAQMKDEDYNIPVLVRSYRGGDNQKTARDACFVMFNACSDKIRSDMSLGGALTGGRYAEISDFRFRQTGDPDEAGEGRRAAIYFTIHCMNRF